MIACAFTAIVSIAVLFLAVCGVAVVVGGLVFLRAIDRTNGINTHKRP